MIDKKVKVLVAKPGMDIHERGVIVLCNALKDAGAEVVYTGLWQTAGMIVSAAIEEDADIVAVSVLDGNLLTIFKGIKEKLKERGVSDLPIVAGGIIQDEIKPALSDLGVTGFYGPSTPLYTIIEHIFERATSKNRKETRDE
jgi:methylmalonyl-CoA mutase C-terminal domain/subunit